LPQERIYFMKKVISANSTLFMSIIEIVIGILLLVNPLGFTSGIIIAFGVVMMISGLGQIIKYFTIKSEDAANSGKLSKGILSCLLGGFCAFNSEWFLVAFPVITILYGVLILVTGVSKLEKAVDMARVKQKYWFVALIGALLALAFAALILVNPFASTTVLWNFIGITLIVEAAMDVVTFIFTKKS